MKLGEEPLADYLGATPKWQVSYLWHRTGFEPLACVQMVTCAPAFKPATLQSHANYFYIKVIWAEGVLNTQIQHPAELAPVPQTHAYG